MYYENVRKAVNFQGETSSIMSRESWKASEVMSGSRSVNRLKAVDGINPKAVANNFYSVLAELFQVPFWRYLFWFWFV